MGLRAAELLAMYSVDEGPLDKSLAGIPGKIAGLAAKIGGAALIGDALMESLDQERLNDKLAAQLGAPAGYAADLGTIAGKLYADAYGDSVGEVNDALRAVLQNGLLPEDATNGQIERMTGKVLNLATTFDQDLGGATMAVGQMIRTGLAKNADQALDILTRGFQQGDDKAGDLLDTLNEYGTQFRKLGLDGTTAMGLISQGLKAGARDSDIVADAIKEFSIRAVDGSKLTADSFKGIGLNARTMAEQIAKGGPTATAALQQTLTALKGVKDPAQQAQLAVGLFGTQAEDLGAALYALDPSTAVQAMGDVAGAADKMGETLNDNNATALEGFKRQAKQALVNVLGEAVLFINNTVVPAVKSLGTWIGENKTPILIVSGLIAAVFLPHLLALGVTATATGLKTAAGWLMTQAGAIAAAAVHSAQVLRMIGGWLLMGATAVAQGVRIAVVWAAQIVASAISGAASFGVQVLRVVAGWVLMGTQSLIQAARMAAAWVIAMGPVGWIIALVVGLVALIIANWDKVKKWTGAAWDWVVGKVKGAWQWVKDAVSSGVSSVVNFVKGLPGKILGAIGNLGSLLLDAGRNLLTGLWNGIQGAASWLWGKVKSFFGDLLPGWVQDMLGISSPSKVFAGFGRYLMQGLGVGIDAEAGTAVKAAARAAAAVTSAAQMRIPTGAGLSSLGNAQAAAALAARATPAGGERGALFHADSVTVIEGTPDDVARQLELGARTRGRW